MKSTASLLLAALCALLMLRPAPATALPINLATLTCQKYQNEVIASPTNDLKVDPINTVMWLFGFSVAKTGAHMMYGDALAGFGFALDAQCKNNPNESLQDALSAVQHNEKNPMDLTGLDCATFQKRDADMRKGDAESA